MSKLSIEQLTLLQNRMANIKGTEKKTIKRLGYKENIELSYSQKRLWFMYQMDPDNPVYNIPKILRLNGELNINALEQSLGKIIERHEVLRSSFINRAGDPRQYVKNYQGFQLPIIKIDGEKVEDRRRACLDFLREDIHQGFDLMNGPVFRAGLYCISETEHVLALVIHHIVSDGWSHQVLFKELSELYKTFSRGEASQLKELPVQYADFVVWQKESLENGSTTEKSLEYWKNNLKHSLPLLGIPTDYKRRQVQDFDGDVETISVPINIIHNLRLFNKRKKSSMFMTMLAAFKVLLYRYTNEEDILVGTANAGREEAELEQLIGFFVNNLVLRTNVTNQLTFNELCQKVKDTMLMAFEHQNIPFEKLVEELQPERSLSYNPIYQVYFTYQKDYWSGASLDNLIVTPINLPLKTSKVDLSMHVEEYHDEMFVHIEFKTSLYKPATIKRLLEHFLIVLEGAIKNPEQQIGTLPILTKKQYADFVQKENYGKIDSNRSACAHQIFEMQAKKMPNRVAISYKNQQLTYGDLNTKANQLAHYLINQGVGPEVKVGICLDRSLEMVISILGILKAGGAYVPLDPHVPSDRLSFIIKDSEVPLIITTSKLKQKLPSNDVKTILLDSKQNDLKIEAKENPLTNVSGNNLAYMIYTSGSTGKPKGVLMEHSNVTRLFDSTSHWYNFTEKDVWTMFHSYAFDFSVWELWGALLYGGKLIIVPYLISRSPEDFYNLLLEEKVTVLNQTPSAFRQIIDFISRKECENELYLRYVIFGGEALELYTLIPWIEIYGDSKPKLVNMYGITETTVHTTYRVITKKDIDNGLGSVIGEAIPDLQLYVLNKSLQPVPMGVIGELYIGGAGVARSYHNRAELTSERFITNPFSKNVQDKLYRTGDLVRYISDKDLEYQGRIDNQVKIRGFRIELGEIQSALESHYCVKEAVVLVKEEKLGDRRLIGFVNTNQDISASTLRSFLKGLLPEYMIPSIVFVSSLPLTANGKLDTKELLVGSSCQMVQEEVYLAPNTSTEKKVANIFSEYLGVLRVSVNESFFEMGGHSLLATQVVSRINDIFRIQLPLRTFFEKTSVDQLAQEIDFQLTKETNHSLPMIKRDRRQPISLSYAQQRLYFLKKLDTDNTSYQIPLPLRLKGTLNIKILESVLHELIKRHETLRTTIKEIDGKPYQVIHEPHQQPLVIQDLSLLHDEKKATELERILKEEWDWKFDLEEGPLFRYYLLRLSNEEHILVTHTHHMFTDGWSLGIFVQELIELYCAFSQNKPNPLRPLEYQYADFSMWQRELLEGGTLENQLRYWKNKLDGDISVLQLPDAKIRKENIESKGEKVEITLSRSLSQNLKTLSKNENSTLFMTFIAAFKVLLGRLSGQDDILIGIPIANRNYSNIERMIGFFVNTLVLRTRINSDQTFLDILNDVRISSLDAYSNQDIPFEKLVEELPLERNINNNPLFEVMVNYHNPEVEKVSGEIPGLKIEEIPLPTSKSKFQMTLHIFELEEIYIQLVYRPDLFSASRIKEILEQFEYLLEQIVSNANKTIGSYSLVTESMQSILPNPISPLQALEFPMITRLIDNWASKTPDKVAIHYKKQNWTYKQLKNHSDAIAKELLKRGLKKGEVVTLVGDRSFGFYASMVGIFKSGGVMLAIDQNQAPIERQRLMINQANASYIVYVSSKPLGEIFDHYKLEIIYVHTEAGYHTDYDISLPTISPNDAAYICFTSGSTGVPKAILGRHIGLNYGLHYLRTKFSVLSAKDRFSQLVYVSFDYIFREVFLPLTCGATLCLPDDPYDLSPDKILSWLVEKDITVVATVPTLAAFWITYAEENLNLKKAIKVTFFAGEPLFGTLVSRWKKIFGGEIVNAYGPSETTMAVAYNRVSENNNIGIQSPGKPMPGVQTLILNKQNQLCSTGELGQIAIRSPYRTLGYLNMPEENEQKFVPNPFNLNSKDDLVYLTGDLGYYSQNGDINVTGRMDFQVKVRGLRIELNEIVTTLLNHEAVDNCIVIDHKDDKEETFLAAYVVKKMDVDRNDLFKYLSEKLMPAMVPAVFVFLDELPLLPNGKVDRRNLPSAAKNSHYSVHSADYVQSRNSVELQIASIWQKALNLDFVGIYDNFFEIGGHSMKAMEIMHELRKCFNCDLPLRAFIESPTVEKLALAVKMYKPEESRKCLVPLQYDSSLEDQPPLFLIHPVGGSVLCYLQLVKELGMNINVYGIQSFGIESEDSAFENVSDMAELYISEILKVAPRGPYRLAAWSFGVLVLYEIAQRIEAMGETIEFLGFIDYLPMHKELTSTPKEHVCKVLLSNLNIDHAVLQGLTEDEGLELTMEYVKKELSPERGETIEAVKRAVKVMVGNGIARDVFQMSGPLKSDVHIYCVTERAPIAPTPIIKEEDTKNITTGEIHFCELPGNHHNICNLPFVKNLARTMKDDIITLKV